MGDGRGSLAGVQGLCRGRGGVARQPRLGGPGALRGAPRPDVPALIAGLSSAPTMPRLPPDRPAPAPPPRPAALGTFLGVYLPTVLTILGVILYLRLGWVVGHAGLVGTLGIVVLANAITLITAVALAAIATNGRVGIGGAYFIISRSLGLEVGGAIGIPLFLSQALSVTLYAYGLAESLTFVWPGLSVPRVAFAIVVAVALLALRGAAAALRAQLPILALIGLSLLALGVGAARAGSLVHVQGTGPSGEVPFWVAFAVFFPAVTGIMAGLGLSGDLRDPRRAIPWGTLTAWATGCAVYLVVPLVLAYAVEPTVLRTDPLVWSKVAMLGPWLVFPGVWGAIFSSAVGSVLGAPRTLQAMALDGLVPRRLARVSAGLGEPVAGLALTVAIALAAVFLGELNAVAEVVSMFFLTVYGTVNLVAALEGLSGDPSWRPQVRAPWPLCLLGALGCLGVMLLINPLASAVAVVAELGLWLLYRRKEHRAAWGDVRRGLLEAMVRWALVRLSSLPLTPRSWRPHILLFVERAEERLELVRFATWFTQERGLVTVCEMWEERDGGIPGDPLERRAEIDRALREEGIVAFGEVDVVDSVERGLFAVAQANGMAGIASNTLMLGWPQDPERLAAWLRVARRLEPVRKSLILGRVDPPAPRRPQPEVHVWWGGLERNGDLMLLLAYLLTRNPQWRRSAIRVLSVASNEMMREATERNLRTLLPEIRIEAQVEVFTRPEGTTVAELIGARSGDADAVFLGLALPKEGEETAYAQRLVELVRNLRTFFFVRNGSLFVGELVLPEPAEPGEGDRDASGEPPGEPQPGVPGGDST
ncbi:MAG: Na-K-Cl cotransporter [Deferrisomatales bacterium]